MSSHTVPFGRSSVSFCLPAEWHVDLLSLVPVPPLADPVAAVNAALDRPLGADLAALRGVRSAAIAINDKTRPVPLATLLPPLLAHLEQIGVPVDATRLIIATGTHAPMRPEEFAAVVPPEILARYPVMSHDCQDPEMLVYLGDTGRGTPVWANRYYLEADLRVAVGDIEPHQFMGYSGGVKSAAIGLAGKETVNRNHAMMTAAGARAGTYYENPARQDVEEIGRLMHVHLALNAILDEERRIVRVFAGDPVAVMEAGIVEAAGLFQVPVAAPYDLIITSPGGHPKDINLYQAQKGLAHAAIVSKKGGALILVAACAEGTGSAGYEHWLQGLTSHEAVLERFAGEGYRIGPHKAFQISRDALGRRVYMVSEQQPEVVRGWLLEPAASVNEAIAALRPHLPTNARVAIMPCANVTVPVLS